MKDSKGRLGLLAYVVAVLCLWWVFHDINFHSFVHQFQVLRPGYLCIAIGFNTAVYFANSLCWLILLRPLTTVSYWKTLQAIYIGLYLNEVLPLRPGELARCYLLSRWSKLRLSNMLASAAAQRILDGLWTLAGFFAVALSVSLPKKLVYGALVLGACVVILAGAWIIYASHRRARRNLGRESSQIEKPGFLDALAFMAHTRIVIPALAASCLSLTCLIVAFWLLMKGGHMDLSLAQAAAVFLIIRVGTMIPNAPGNIGAYQFFCVFAMGLFGVNKSAAAAFSLLNYSAFTVPLLVGGTIAVAASGLKFRSLLADAES